MFNFIKKALDTVRSVFVSRPIETDSRSQPRTIRERLGGFFRGLFGRKPIESEPVWKIPEPVYSEGRVAESWDYDIGIDIRHARDILQADPIPQANLIRVIVTYYDRDDNEDMFSTKDHDFRTSSTPAGSADRVIEMYQDITDRYQIQNVINITVRLFRRF